MTRISVSLDEPVAAAVRTAAGGDGRMSSWIAGIIRERLLNDEAAAAGAYDRRTDDEDYERHRLLGEA